MKRLIGPIVGLWVVGIVLVSSVDAGAQWFRRERQPNADQSAGPGTGMQAPRRMIDAPTAGTLERGSFDTELRAFSHGGVLGVLQVGLTNHWQIGLAYGGTEMISSTNPKWNPRMQFLTKVQLLSESMAFPAIAVGFEEQGFGPWTDSLRRYESKSKGFYAVASKGYRSSAFTSSVHGGINYSREDKDDDDIDFFVGTDMRFNTNLGMVVEYDLGLNDDRRPNSFGRGRGYLNAGMRWTILERLQMEASLKDLLTNRKSTKTIGRELRIIYVEKF
jgi:hypothetical protein